MHTCIRDKNSNSMIGFISDDVFNGLLFVQVLQAATHFATSSRGIQLYCLQIWKIVLTFSAVMHIVS